MKRFRIAVRERRALNCFVSGDYEIAEKHFTAIERLQPDHPGLNHNLGLVAMAKGDHGEAERRFLGDLERLGDYYPRLRVLADLYYVWGKREQAHEYYTRALSDSPPAGSRSIMRERLSMCSSQQRYANVQTSVSEYDRGSSLERAGDVSAALDSYRTAIDLDATNLLAVNNAGVILLNHVRDARAAVEMFARGVSMERVDWLVANLDKANRSLVEQESTNESGRA